MIEKGKEVKFLNDDLWLNDLAFFVDITNYMADLNQKLQGREQFVHRKFENVTGFLQKLNLLKNQINFKKTSHFRILSTRPVDTVKHIKYVIG